MREFERVAIVNRGEAAMRFIHAVREFNREQKASLCTIGLFTDSDRHAMFVREADEAVSIGPARVVDAITHQSKSSYVDYGCLEKALREARAEAVWVGWGFVAEHATFADLCGELGIVFIGPSGDVMRQLGDKITSKLLAEQARIPVAPWSGGPVDTLDEAVRHGERLGYPLLVKATAGGGGHGIRRVDDASQLSAAFESARTEAYKAFGSPTVFMESLIAGARHVEVQIIADVYGNTWAVGVRDCTIQRRHQKILEEAPSPALTPEQHQYLREASVRLSKAVGYQNAGTVEFLYEPSSRTFSFMEMNTRLQVEHPVTECTTGLDMVKLQLHVALGRKLEGEAPRTVGHAIEVRLNAEDPDSGFAPAPGLVDRFRILTGPGVRVDTGVAEGDEVPPEFDSMIAKIIAFGRNRSEALARLHRTLRESVVVLRGGASNKAFLLGLLNRPEVQSGEVDVGWMDRLSAAGEHLSRRHADIALVHAAIETYVAASDVEQTEFYTSALRGRPQVRADAGRTIDLRYHGRSYSMKTCRVGPQHYRVDAGGARIDAHLEKLGPFEYWLTAGDQRYHIVSVSQGLTYRIDVDGVSHRIDREDGGIVRSPAPAVVVSIGVQPGDTVAAGQLVAVLEAMKLEMPVMAPFAGKVRRVMTIPHVQVASGTPLLQIDPSAEDEFVCDLDSVEFAHPLRADDVADAESKWRKNLEELRQLMLGFDIESARTATLLSEQREFGEPFALSEEVRRAEDEILQIFVDICALFTREPEAHELTDAEGPTNEAYLFLYLRMLDTKGSRLPPAFMDALERALWHYGVTSRERTPELEQSLLWIYRSHERIQQEISPVVAILERRLAHATMLSASAGEAFRTLLDGVAGVTSDAFPAVSALAREVRYRYFDHPMFEEARRQVYRDVEEHLAYLDARPDAHDRLEHLHALIECPHPLIRLFIDRSAAASPAACQLMLEVLTARYYRIRALSNLHATRASGRSCVTAEYDHEGKRVHVFSVFAPYPELPDAAAALTPAIREVDPEHDVVLDFFLFRNPAPDEADTTEAQVRAWLNHVEFPRQIRRIVVVAGSCAGAQSSACAQHFTFRPGPAGYEEEKIYRGVHPMIAKRLHFWRLNNFHIERLPSADDVYLLHAVARENPKDERLFACVEVRDVTQVRDASGAVVQLPHLERMFTEAVAAMRHFQVRRPPKERLYWNRLLLYIWPPLELAPDDLNRVVHKLAPSTDRIGLEMVVVRVRIPNPETGELRDTVIRISSPTGRRVLMTFRPASTLQPLKPLTEYTQKVVRMKQRGFTYPYEIIKMLTPSPDDSRAGFPHGEFVEYDLDDQQQLVPVSRPYGQNKANIITGVIRNFTSRYPDGMTRVLLLGDPSRDLGALAEPESRRIIAAIDLAESFGVPVDWFPISAGAKISMESGVENMDWIARVLRRIVHFTQSGGEINLIIDGVNVGAQPYWNAESTMLMHTRGILVMTANAAMVLTGKRALDYSGSVSAEDNRGIGGYDRIMGVNGQSQYWARDLDEACGILFKHYEHTYVSPGERFPRRAETNDPIERNVCEYPVLDNRDSGFTKIGDIFSDETNPGRKKSFDIRKVMIATVDSDYPPLERWAGMRAAETAVVWDAHLGGHPVCLIGIESRPIPRLGFVPADGPDQWTAGTLFPLSSKKVARAINSASNNRPVVMLANLSGFDGSPESMRRLQLEYGAEIGRAVVNFEGPMVFCVISRYHGGAYVVFSRMLNEGLEVAALEGTYASVIGGAPAAAVVFANEVEQRARKDPRLQELAEVIAKASGAEKGRLQARWNEQFKHIHSEKLGQVAEEFDGIHSVHRALRVGAIHRIVPPSSLRPYLIDAVERGISRTISASPEEASFAEAETA